MIVDDKTWPNHKLYLGVDFEVFIRAKLIRG